MPWLQIILETDADVVDQISDGLFAVGAVSVTLQDAKEQPLYEPVLNTTPVWKRTRVIGLFDGDADIQRLQSQLQAMPPYRIEILADQEWTRVWMDDFHPMRFGERVWICPSWQTPPAPQAVNILLDPGLAFGTGTHTTTALCLEWLDQQNDFSGKTLIDYGCGSGILGIAAAKLGADCVWAVDNDPQALLATIENAKKNGVAALIRPVLPEQLPDLKADAIVANILAAPLINLATAFIGCLNVGAPLVLSGILREQCDNVKAAYAPGFGFAEVVERDSWLRVVAIRK